MTPPVRLESGSGFVVASSGEACPKLGGFVEPSAFAVVSCWEPRCVWPIATGRSYSLTDVRAKFDVGNSASSDALCTCHVCGLRRQFPVGRFMGTSILQVGAAGVFVCFNTVTRLLSFRRHRRSNSRGVVGGLVGNCKQLLGNDGDLRG